MGSMSISHWIIVLVIIILLFGAKKLPELAKGTGKAIKEFKKEIESSDEDIKKVEKKDENTIKSDTVRESDKV